MKTGDKRFLFICGCPRSGTTALWRIFSSHKEIALGCERFILKVMPTFQLSKKDFTSKNFFTFKEKRIDIQNYYNELESNYEDKNIYGDKIPHLFLDYYSLFNEFENAQVIFIMRNILDVAESYNNRLNDINDVWSKNHLNAIKEWNISLARTFQAIEQGYKIKVIEYEDIFLNESNQLSQILQSLNINQDDTFLNALKRTRKRAVELEKKRVLTLSSMIKREILNQSNIKLYLSMQSKTLVV